MEQKPGIGGYVCLRMLTATAILVGAGVLGIRGAVGHSLGDWGALMAWLVGSYLAFEVLMPPPREDTEGSPDVSDHR